MPTVAELLEQAGTFHRASRFEQAIDLYKQVLQADRNNAIAWHQLGVIAFYTHQFDTSFEYLCRAIRLDGGVADFHHNLAACCRALGRLEDAAVSYEQALRLNPDLQVARAHLCLTLHALGRAADADRVAAELFALPRITAEEHAICGVLALLRGDFSGWEENEFSQQLPSATKLGAPEKKWDGSPLAGRKLVIWAEQGLGDTIQFLRYVDVVRESGGQPILAIQKPLIPLVRQSVTCPVVVDNGPWPPHDLHVSTFGLPWAMHTTWATLPAKVPYVRASDELVAQWRERLAGERQLRVGIAWQGNHQFQFDRMRSIPLAEFAPLAKVNGVRMYSLQKGRGSEQLAAVANRFDVIDLGPQLDNTAGAFMDTAAVMKNLDLVITSDTAIAHLAGALGVKVWVVLSVMPDYRWMLDREDNPWYPTMRLFRQTRANQWAEVFERVAAELAPLAAARAAND